MGKTFFLADTHFGDDNIRRYENRPFPSVEQMDAMMTSLWNDTVGPDDDVYVVGDFGADKLMDHKCYLGHLNGRIHLIKGNHDIQSNQYYRDCGFEEVYDHPIILDGFWIVSHEPLYVNENMPYANIFGHVHNSPLFKDFSKQHYCVSVERIGFMPIDFEEIKRKIREAVDNG